MFLIVICLWKDFLILERDTLGFNVIKKHFQIYDTNIGILYIVYILCNLSYDIDKISTVEHGLHNPHITISVI